MIKAVQIICAAFFVAYFTRYGGGGEIFLREMGDLQQYIFCKTSISFARGSSKPLPYGVEMDF